jgi:hypothetical protein
VTRQRLVLIALAVGTATAVALIGCFELSGPPAGLSSISALEVAWPSVVHQDVLRDSTGAVAPLRVEAFDGDGNPANDATVTFIALDRGLHVDANGVVHGDSVRTSPVRVVAQVERGGDVIQTPEARIDVVPVPDSLLPVSPHTLPVKQFGFSDGVDITSDPLKVTVANRATNSGVRSWVIRYEIVAQPPGQDGQATAFFTGAGAARVTYDTTQATGVADRRRVILRQTLLATREGSLEVRVVATVRGVPGSPITFVVPFDADPGTSARSH